MKLVAQRVVRPRDQASGINAFYYVHPNALWLDTPPPDLGRGKLVHQVLEVEPPMGNRVRSYLEITTPDSTSNESIAESVMSGADLLAEAKGSLPWRVEHAGTLFEFNLERALAPQWELELRILLGYCLHLKG